MKNSISLMLFFLCFSLTIKAQDATEIIKKAESVLRGSQSSQATLSMKIIRPKWTREMSMKTWTKGEEYSLILITSPVRDKGTTFLKRDKEMWNWQPAIERSIKMPPSMMAQSWMGSDFTNDDLIRQSSLVDDFKQSLNGEEIIDGAPCYKISLFPKEETTVVWGKIIVWIDKSNFVQRKAEFYDEDDFLVNTMYGKNVKKISGKLIASQLIVEPADFPGNKTIVEYIDLKFDTALDESFFSIQNMRNVR